MSRALTVIVDRCHVDGTDLHEMPSLAPQLDEIRRLAAEIPYEPSFGSIQPDMHALQVRVCGGGCAARSLTSHRISSMRLRLWATSLSIWTPSLEDLTWKTD